VNKPDDGLTLMVTDDLSRYFLVPDDLELPFGDLSVRTVLGHRRFVDEKAIAVHEVPKAQADARMKAKVEAFFGSLRESVVSRAPGPPAPLNPELQRDANLLVSGLREIMTGIREALAEDREKKS
jgi:hypothetical protein